MPHANLIKMIGNPFVIQLSHVLKYSLHKYVYSSDAFICYIVMFICLLCFIIDLRVIVVCF